MSADEPVHVFAEWIRGSRIVWLASDGRSGSDPIKSRSGDLVRQWFARFARNRFGEDVTIELIVEGEHQ